MKFNFKKHLSWTNGPYFKKVTQEISYKSLNLADVVAC